MSNSICGIDCGKCDFKNSCAGCAETNGHPFGGECIVAECCLAKGEANCGGCQSICALKARLIDEFNALGIPDMPRVTELSALCGAYVNLEYTLPGGQAIRFWDGSRVYLGWQLPKENSDRCYGLTADENYLLVCEYSAEGVDAEIVLFKRRKK